MLSTVELRYVCSKIKADSMNTEQRPPFPEDDYWTHDYQIGEGTFYRDSRHAIRLKLHRSTERYAADEDEIIPVQTKHGERLYFQAKPYILVPDFRVSVNLYPYPTPGDQGAVGEVASSEWEGMKHDELGTAQAWYYPADRILVLWEVDLHPRYHQAMAMGDGNLAAVWQGFERVLLEHCPDARLLATPFDDPNYERDDYQEFLRSQGYQPWAHAAFAKQR